ncbi:hypothetical protein [Xylanimonas sp. McL0601]|uniref:hypothetical protein n=1 Tax=Xylanimonas sp. McL0601 TaxID=3414739 RepID=UPI003CE9E712
MSGRVSKTARGTAAIVAAVLVVGASWFPHSRWSWGAQSDADLVTAAHADVGRTAVDDTAARTFTVSRGGHAQATATSSTVCDGCTGRAATVEVAYVPRGGVTADNVAAAWATGTSGEASAVSVQVVVQRPGTDVIATNRALAVDTACEGCKTDAVAVQVVILTRLDRSVSARTQGMLEDLAAVLGTPVPQGLRLHPSHHGPDAHHASAPATSGDGVAVGTPAVLALPDSSTEASASTAAATGTSPAQQAIDAVVQQLTAEFSTGTVSVDVDVQEN